MSKMSHWRDMENGAAAAVLPQPVVPPSVCGGRGHGPRHRADGRDAPSPGAGPDPPQRAVRRGRRREAGRLHPQGQLSGKEESGFMAIPMLQNGVVTVAVDYDIAPKGNMDLMVSQVRRSVVSVLQQYSHISSLYLVGHSAGAHLAAMVLSTDWSQYSVTPKITGALLVSGIYDLLPLLSTKTNDPLKMTQEVALRNSPMRLVPEAARSAPHCRVAVALAEHDSPAFRSQSEEYYKDLKEVGLDVVLEDVPNTDHFDIIERMVDGQYQLTQLLLKMMGKS
ncbi:kynurenine formamidase isoform X2 [Gadus macrocephalus]|uniref:kynurenine formamidase isoform X2 n=1 Tax=Gadus macrocephalus TaxID=80720 RepID=UPI0028CB84F8|nr:kynurenine formamidase isoform X2 [Gadus macrocephalus]